MDKFRKLEFQKDRIVLIGPILAGIKGCRLGGQSNGSKKTEKRRRRPNLVVMVSENIGRKYNFPFSKMSCGLLAPLML